MTTYFPSSLAAIYTHRVILANGKTLVGGGFAQSIEEAARLADAHRATGKDVRIVCR